MKKIEKNEPQFFSDYPKPHSWGELSKKIGWNIRIFILSGLTEETEVSAEQNFQCAYTETDIEPEGISSHIDFSQAKYVPNFCF